MEAFVRPKKAKANILADKFLLPEDFVMWTSNIFIGFLFDYVEKMFFEKGTGIGGGAYVNRLDETQRKTKIVFEQYPGMYALMINVYLTNKSAFVCEEKSFQLCHALCWFNVTDDVRMMFVVRCQTYTRFSCLYACESINSAPFTRTECHMNRAFHISILFLRWSIYITCMVDIGEDVRK